MKELARQRWARGRSPGEIPRFQRLTFPRDVGFRHRSQTSVPSYALPDLSARSRAFARQSFVRVRVSILCVSMAVCLMAGDGPVSWENTSAWETYERGREAEKAGRKGVRPFRRRDVRGEFSTCEWSDSNLDSASRDLKSSRDPAVTTQACAEPVSRFLPPSRVYRRLA